MSVFLSLLDRCGSLNVLSLTKVKIVFVESDIFIFHVGYAWFGTRQTEWKKVVKIFKLVFLLTAVCMTNQKDMFKIQEMADLYRVFALKVFC